MKNRENITTNVNGVKTPIERTLATDVTGRLTEKKNTHDSANELSILP